MGCGNSKQKLCRNCKSTYPPPLLRSYSLIHPPAVALPPPKETDNNNNYAVALKIKLDSLDHKHNEIAAKGLMIKKEEEEKIAIGIIDEAKTWSKLMDDKLLTKIVPITPTKTPTGKPEIIDAWELMEGLEGNSPISVIKSPFHNYTRSFSFCFSSNQSFDDDDLTPTIDKTQPLLAGNDQSGGKKLPAPAKEKDTLIVYFTSLRGVRKTYDDCSDVRRILKQSNVKIDERDVSMDYGFKTELKHLLDDGSSTNDDGSIVLPKVFIGRRCIGGAEEIRRMHEEGELRKAVDGVALADDNGGGGVCEVCGDVRFVPCATCFGSCKVYYEEECDNNNNMEKVISGFRRCHDCNENGLVRCSMCCHS